MNENKHLTLDERNFIEQELAKNTSFREIANYLSKNPTTDIIFVILDVQKNVDIAITAMIVIILTRKNIQVCLLVYHKF